LSCNLQRALRKRTTSKIILFQKVSFISLVRSPTCIKACEPRRESLKASAEDESKMEEKGYSKEIKSEI